MPTNPAAIRASPRGAAQQPVPPPRFRSRSIRMLRNLLDRLLVGALWMLACPLLYELPPAPAAAGMVVLTGAFLWRYVRRPLRPGRERIRATLRLRPLGAAAPRVLAAVPVWLLFNTALAAAYAGWVAAPRPGQQEWLVLYAQRPLGWLPLALQALLFAPLVEEVFFRGFIQRSMQRRFGPALGIVLAALLFAAFHGESWRFGYLLAGGIVFGAAVHYARSLWAGVILHVGANTFGVLLDAVQVPVSALPGGSNPREAMLLLALLLGSAVVLAQQIRSFGRAADKPDRRIEVGAPGRLFLPQHHSRR